MVEICRMRMQRNQRETIFLMWSRGWSVRLGFKDTGVDPLGSLPVTHFQPSGPYMVVVRMKWMREEQYHQLIWVSMEEKARA